MTETALKAPAKRAARSAPPASVNEQTDEQATIERLQAELVTKNREIADWVQKWERTWQRLAREARSRQWCGEYDDICRELGGLPRQVDVVVEMSGTARFQLSAEHVRSLLGIQRNRLTITELGGPITIRHTVSRTIIVLPATCGCDQVNLEDQLTAHFRNQGIRPELSDVQVRCSSEHCRNRPQPSAEEEADSPF